ncbi:hypothetical protein ACSQ67_026114 [Phaseolus vulgaris]
MQYFATFTVFTTIFMGLYVLVHIWLHLSTIQGLEFGGLDLPIQLVNLFSMLSSFFKDVTDDPPSIMDVVVYDFDGPFDDTRIHELQYKSGMK